MGALSRGLSWIGGSTALRLFALSGLVAQLRFACLPLAARAAGAAQEKCALRTADEAQSGGFFFIRRTGKRSEKPLIRSARRKNGCRLKTAD